ncbi:BatA domain-containing protein [Aegicerativicinus sediminis]|uniref:BatA domain-containing protein n=1 Tax=Aegicerativicinus sediminis TaxID=2893202 RepID=UPI001E4F673C|nr:BatA domain-containing protein [Aegicerativicinus sediminis]
MQFKHPELLYALFLLVIPILIHLFQLRRFQRTDFTNVAFLKKITIQTRKSSQLKKWLTLITRLGILSCLILAFAQPFKSNFKDFRIEKETVIYLDNSFSMQMKGQNGSLLNDAINDLLQYLDGDDKITLFTNSQTYKNTSLKAVRNDLIETKFSPKQLSLSSVLQKAKGNLGDNTNSLKNLLIISDFQDKSEDAQIEFDSTATYNLVQLKPVNTFNTSIDSAYIAETKPETIEIAVRLGGNVDDLENIPISLYNENQLVAKSTITDLDSNEARFSINRNQHFKGKISIEDPNLTYDNDLFFNIADQSKIKVLTVNGVSGNFLERIFTQDEFELVQFTNQNLDYSQIAEQNLIVLNELDNLNESLLTALANFRENGGSIVVIPSIQSDLISYKSFSNSFISSSLDSIIQVEKRITDINFDHPLLNQVFDTRVRNFQYPNVNTSYALSGPLATNILTFEDGSPFLVNKGEIYFFTAPLNDSNSNFKNSPLIVPVLYNIGKQSLKIPKLYYSIHYNNQIDIPISISNDRILSIRQDEEDIIPLQQAFSNKVTLQMQEIPEKAGIVSVFNKDDKLTDLAFNYDRSESNLNYLNVSNFDNVVLSNSVKDVLTDIKSLTNVNVLWKWFVIFAIGFLIMEILILKFLK